jgi:hypothetical protein
MKKTLIINISKSISQKDRSNRIHYILHPMFYVQVSYQKGTDTQRHAGWKYDTSYDIDFSTIPKWENMLQSVNLRLRMVLVNYLCDITIGRNPYCKIHNIYFDTLSEKENNVIRTIILANNMNDDNILNAAIVIDTILATYFKFRSKPHQPVGFIKPSKVSYFDLYIYCKIDFHRKKVRCLLAEDYLLKHFYDAPMIVLRYEATPTNPILVNIIYKLKDKGYIEVLYRWFEEIVEKHCEMFRINEHHYITQIEIVKIILDHTKTEFLKHILDDLQLKVMVTMMMQVSEKIHNEFIKFKVKEITNPGDQLESINIINSESPVLIFPNSDIFTLN